jgi:hypothetical protein
MVHTQYFHVLLLQNLDFVWLLRGICRWSKYSLVGRSGGRSGSLRCDCLRLDVLP